MNIASARGGQASNVELAEGGSASGGSGVEMKKMNRQNQEV